MEPRLEFAFEVRLTLGPRLKLDPLPIGGSRLFVPVAGGTFEGPRLRGHVLPHGAEFPHVRPDGVFSFDARYFMQEADGTLIYIQNRGFRHGPPEVMERLWKLAPGDVVDPSEYYFHCTPVFETPPGPHDWLTRHVFVHRCPGSTLALAEFRVFLEEWLKRIPDFWIKPGARVRTGSGIVHSVLSLPLAWEAP